MKQSLHIAKEPNFQKIIVASAALHLLFITLVAIPLKTREREYRSYFVNLVGPAEIRREMKTPAKKVTEVHQKKAKETAKREKKTAKVKPPLKRRVKPKSKADMSLEPPEKAKRVTKEIERLRAIHELSKLKRQKEEHASRVKEMDESIAQAIKGLREKKLISVSRGAGIPSHMASSDTESYYALITRKIWSEWILPEYDASDLEVIISIKIDTDGTIVSQDVERSSGNALFDRSAKKAIMKASPLPAPPVEMEIGVRFYL